MIRSIGALGAGAALVATMAVVPAAVASAPRNYELTGVVDPATVTPAGFTIQVDGGNGHAGKRSPDVHFGLGSTTGPVKVSIKWRDPDGVPREDTRTLTPGWHTVVLGWPSS